MTRQEVYALIDGERDYQDHLAEVKGWDKMSREPATRPAEYLSLLRTYVRRAEDAFADKAGNEACLDVIRKIAGIAVHCMEDNGAPPRKMPEPQSVLLNPGGLVDLH